MLGACANSLLSAGRQLLRAVGLVSMQFVTTWTMVRDASEHVKLSQILMRALSTMETAEERNRERKMASARADGDSS